jgi:hypothetical protein
VEITVDDYREELGRWIARAKAQLAPLPVHSLARRQLADAIARMEQEYGHLQERSRREPRDASRHLGVRSHTE